MNGTYLLVAFIVGAAVLAIIFKQSSLQGDWPIQSNALAYAMETFEEDVAAAEETEGYKGEDDAEDTDEVKGYEGEEKAEDAEGFEGYEERDATDEHDDDAVENFQEDMTKAQKRRRPEKKAKAAEAKKQDDAISNANKAQKAKGSTPGRQPGASKTEVEFKSEVFEGFEDASGQMPYLGSEYAAI